MNNLKAKYNEEVKKQLQEKFKYASSMQTPKLEKIVLNMTAGNEVSNSKAVKEVFEELQAIAGQKPFETRAKKSLASWKLREGMPMGAKVTLRNENMWNFLDKLINIVLPRTRDFKGTKTTSFDGRGNYSFGIEEHIIFPEIDFNKTRKIKGLDVIIVTSAGTNDEAFELLNLLGMPFQKKENN